MPAIESVHNELGANVRFVGIATEDNLPNARQFAAGTGITYDLWADPDGKALTTFKLSAYPPRSSSTPTAESSTLTSAR